MVTRNQTGNGSINLILGFFVCLFVFEKRREKKENKREQKQKKKKKKTRGLTFKDIGS